MLATGKDPGQLVIRHRCDSPPCCTPGCFTVGTQADNIRDAIIRRRLNIDGLSAYRAIRIAQTAARTGADASCAPGAARSRTWPTSRPRRAARTAGRTGAGRALAAHQFMRRAR